MNRIEFMTELAALLQDVPAEERRDAMKYYNDYFDDAGEENEQRVIEELESPAKIAATIKADLGGSTKEYGEFTEKGYTDSRFDYKEMPAGRVNLRKDQQGSSHQNRGHEYQGNGYQGNNYQYQSTGEQPRTSNALKIFLIILLVVVGAPIIIPVAIAIIAVIFAMGITLFALFAGLVIASVAVAFAGVCVFIAGIVNLIPEIAIGLALIGTGLILAVLGTIGTVVSVRICWIVLPGIIRGFIWLCRRPFQRRAVV